MKSIGFENFRRFVEFPEFNFNDITLMVGKNNSGKSTLVKAVLLVIDYLKNQQNHQFSFSTANVKDVNIISFDRARCKLQPDDVIYFGCNIAPSYDVSIKISGDRNSISGNVEEIKIKDHSKKISFAFSHTTNSVQVIKEQNSNVNSIEDITKDIELKIEEKNSEARNLIETGNDPTGVFKEIDLLNKEIERQKEHLLLRSEKKLQSKGLSTSYEINIERNSSNGNFEEYIKEFLDENENEKRRLINLRDKDEFSDELNERLEEVNLVFESKSEMENSISDFVKAINSHYYYYWSAETQKQSALFSIRDNNNALAMAIHDFCKMQIRRGDEEWLFIENQMRGFGVGDRFDLITHAGEAYECDIIEEQEFAVSLADKGMGSIQLMTLFFRLAVIIRQQKLHKENITLVIEEPELNLHPQLQSQLFSLFESVNRYHSVKFIIETHSEYIIRQSQVLVAEEKYKDEDDLQNNVFSTYYFKSDGVPYMMKYRTDGKFSNEFGSGFFDVAADLAFELF